MNLCFKFLSKKPSNLQYWIIPISEVWLRQKYSQNSKRSLCNQCAPENSRFQGKDSYQRKTNQPSMQVPFSLFIVCVRWHEEHSNIRNFKNFVRSSKRDICHQKCISYFEVFWTFILRVYSNHQTNYHRINNQYNMYLKKEMCASKCATS